MTRRAAAVALVFVLTFSGFAVLAIASVGATCRQQQRSWSALHAVILEGTKPAELTPAMRAALGVTQRELERSAAATRARLERAQGPRPTC